MTYTSLDQLLSVKAHSVGPFGSRFLFQRFRVYKFVSFHTIACMASDVLFILSFIIGYSIHLFQYAVFKVRCGIIYVKTIPTGLKWTRTTDLTLIRRAL